MQSMWNVTEKMIPVITGATGTIISHSDNTWATYRESMKLRHYKKKSYIGHCTHTAESTNVKVQNIFHGEATLHVAQIVNAEKLQHSMP